MMSGPCLVCGSEAGVSARFCGGCGAPTEGDITIIRPVPKASTDIAHRAAAVSSSEPWTHATSQEVVATSAGAALSNVGPSREMQRFGQIVICDNAWVFTPAGPAHLTDCEFSIQQTPHTFSRPVWSGGMVAVSIIAGLLSCGLGLLLLFLSRTQQTETVQVETVTVDSSTFSYSECQLTANQWALGASAFVSWAKTWKAQLAC